MPHGALQRTPFSVPGPPHCWNWMPMARLASSSVLLPPERAMEAVTLPRVQMARGCNSCCIALPHSSQLCQHLCAWPCASPLLCLCLCVLWDSVNLEQLVGSLFGSVICWHDRANCPNLPIPPKQLAASMYPCTPLPDAAWALCRGGHPLSNAPCTSHKFRPPFCLCADNECSAMDRGLSPCSCTAS